MTLGTRVAAFDAEGRVFLVRHTYIAGWHLPGGGVDPGETCEASARRELAEEGNIDCPEGLRLVSLHFNRRASRRDHVVFYRADGVRQTAPRRADGEIAECGFFPLSDLPEGVTAATRARLCELAGTAPSAPHW
nr:NUDIX domain-containing protein [Aureimonas altamirensis]